MFDFSDPAKSSYYPDRLQGNSGIFKLLGGLIVIKESPWAKPSIALARGGDNVEVHVVEMDNTCS
jgi:hypothetical protein